MHIDKQILIEKINILWFFLPCTLLAALGAALADFPAFKLPACTKNLLGLTR